MVQYGSRFTGKHTCVSTAIPRWHAEEPRKTLDVRAIIEVTSRRASLCRVALPRPLAILSSLSQVGFLSPFAIAYNGTMVLTTLSSTRLLLFGGALVAERNLCLDALAIAINATFDKMGLRYTATKEPQMVCLDVCVACRSSWNSSRHCTCCSHRLHAAPCAAAYHGFKQYSVARS